MATIKVYDQEKQEVGSVELAPEVFEVEARPEILNLVVRAQRAAQRAGTHKAKRADGQGQHAVTLDMAPQPEQLLLDLLEAFLMKLMFRGTGKKHGKRSQFFKIETYPWLDNRLFLEKGQ